MREIGRKRKRDIFYLIFIDICIVIIFNIFIDIYFFCFVLDFIYSNMFFWLICIYIINSFKI